MRSIKDYLKQIKLSYIQILAQAVHNLDIHATSCIKIQPLIQITALPNFFA